MTHLPLRVRPLGGTALLVNDTGRFFQASSNFLDRLTCDVLDADDMSFLRAEGHAVDDSDPFGNAAHAYGVAERLNRAGPLDYLILVPTLRCNLSCSYCQVSRAGLSQRGYDWTDETLTAVLDMLDGLDTPQIKIEFQGGEPTLRPDLIRVVMDRCQRFDVRQFVICTNLHHLDSELLEIFDNPQVYLSTSLDGDAATHGANRTGSETDHFLANLETVLERYGPEKISALPTINPTAPPDPDTLINAYAARGLTSIFLRPINYQGFARKRHKGSREQSEDWRHYHERFVRRVISRNWEDRGRVLEETYFSICLRRIFQPGADRHVDLRNPNPMGADYIVVDHDGIVYPTDEARMLSRSGVIDLAIGHITTGWDTDARRQLNAHATNQFDPDCQRCAYQPFCGRDVIDDLTRYGRIDIARTETEFCRRHLHIFDLAFQLIYDDDPAVRYSLSRWLRLQGTPPALGIRHS
jgi:His-Xaa-Ser system radical SAM maturase HxsB